MRQAWLVWSAFAFACLGCDFSPGLGDGYPPCVDGACLRAGCECLGGQVCVPQNSEEGPEACLPTACVEGQACDDGDACTQGESCTVGVCQGGEPVACDDQDDCTQNLCEPAMGCYFPPRADLIPEGPPGDPSCENLVDDDCDSRTDVDDPGCVACSGDAECEDLDPCTLDSCVGGACEILPLGDGHACDDGDACSVGESCQGGQCLGGLPRDADGDGFAGAACGGDDCDDANSAVNPQAFEGGPGSPTCTDGQDNDCDGLTDGLEPGCGAAQPPGPLCSGTGWCWENPLPQGNDLLGVWGQGTRAWGVGPNGIVIRFDTNGLTLELLDGFDDLRAIHGAGSVVIAAGGNRAFKRMADSWAAMVLEQGVGAFYDVWVEPSGQYWVSGTEGFIASFLEAMPVYFSPPSSDDLTAISALDGVPWVADAAGRRYRFTIDGWEETGTVVENSPVRDLALYRSTGPGQGVEALAIGDGGFIERFREESWRRELAAGPDLYGLSWDPVQGGLAVGDGAIYAQVDPTSDLWALQAESPEAWRGVWSPAVPDGVGSAGIAVGLRGALFGKAGTVTLATNRRFANDLHAVWCLPDRAWAVGAGGKLLEIQVVDGESIWSLNEVDGVDLLGVWGDESGVAWAVGTGGHIVRLESGTYSPEISGVEATLRAVVGLSTGGADPELWAVGDDGTVLRRVEGTWTSVERTTAEDLHAAAASGLEVWAAGDGGTMLRCAAGTCLHEAMLSDLGGLPAALRAVVIVSSEEGYAGAEDGSVYRLDTQEGWAWRAQPAPGRPIRAMTARYLEGANGGWDFWAVGDRGLALDYASWDVAGWHQVQIGANVDLHGLCAWTPADQTGAPPALRAVGAGGAVLSLHAP
jgi:hypothetical protein